MVGRELKHTVRYPLMLVASILSPVVMLLLFDFILGGPIGAGLGDAARGGPYVDFLVPGILMMTVAAGSSTTAINVCTDMTGGIIDRFRTMAVSSGAVLAGHVGGGVLRTLVTTAVVTVVALLIGFRPKAAVEAWFAFLGIVVAFSFALAWLSVALGLVTKSRGRRERLPPFRSNSCYRSCPARLCRLIRCLPVCAGSLRTSRSRPSSSACARC